MKEQTVPPFLMCGPQLCWQSRCHLMFACWLWQAEARAQPLPPGPGRDMSFEEKRQLSVALSSLPYEKLSLVMELCENDPSVAGRQVRCLQAWFFGLLR
mgnify:CR=1 FL=1